jgi:L-asparaginase/Glu-tRNA(Gln) amidotransferase subunit D
MRPSTAYSADGPANLLQAVTVAASEESKNRGALISMNDRVGQAYYTQKTHRKYSTIARGGYLSKLAAPCGAHQLTRQSTL